MDNRWTRKVKYENVLKIQAINQYHKVIRLLKYIGHIIREDDLNKLGLKNDNNNNKR